MTSFDDVTSMNDKILSNVDCKCFIEKLLLLSAKSASQQVDFPGAAQSGMKWNKNTYLIMISIIVPLN